MIASHCGGSLCSPAVFFALLTLACTPEPTLPQGTWNLLHGNGARTVASPTWGIEADPQVRFSHDASDEPACFSGPILGVADEEEWGIDHLIYRVEGPGPMSLSPPEGIAFVLGTQSRVQVFHPETGEVLASEEFNAGLFQNFAATDVAGNVIVQDIGRIQKFSPGLGEQLWLTDLSAEVGNELTEATPAGSIAFAPDGAIILPFLNGRIYVLDAETGAVRSRLVLTELDPAVSVDPQLGSNTYLRNAVAYDGGRFFLLVHEELIAVDYDAETQALNVVDRLRYPGFSSSTPTVDVAQQQVFLVTFDPEDATVAPMLRAFDYSALPMSEKWAVPTEIAVLESEDQLTTTLASGDILINNALYGPISAYRVRADGSGADPLWTAAETVGGSPMMYIATASDEDGMLYVFDNTTRSLHGLDAASGAVMWTHAIDAQSIKKPIPYKGMVLLDHNAGLIALEAP